MTSCENRPADLKKLKITDPFWAHEMELVRTEVIPYQWEALNDRIPDAAKSFAMHNFRGAALLRAKKEADPSYPMPVFSERGFEILPPDGEEPADDRFYGFVFQDSDFYKWVEAAAYSLTQHPDSVLEATADEAIDLVRRAQAPDGYLDTYYILNGRDREFTNLRDNHELYCFGHLTEAAVAYSQATGKKVLLEVAERYADYISSKIGREEGKKRGYPGHEVAELALVRLYNETGEERFLKLSEYFIDERGQKPHYFDIEGHFNRPHSYENSDLPYAYFQAHLPVREQDEALGHAVRAVYLYSGMADIARLTKDPALLKACDKLWHSVVHEKMYITGSIGSTHLGEAFSYPFDLPNDTAYAESCAAIGLVFFARRMLQLSPRSEYADIMEKCLYNGILSGMALDGRSFFYVNPLEVFPEADNNDGRKKHVKTVRQKWFGCACCPPNIARMIASVGAYAYTETDDTLFVNLYLGSEYEKEIGKKTAKVVMENVGDDPACWKYRCRIEGAADEKLTIAFRKPEWCAGFALSTSGADITEKDGYFYVTKTLTGEDEILVTLPLRVRFMTADTRVREDTGKAAVQFGPWVYCAEEIDNGKNLHLLRLPCDVTADKVRLGTIEIAGRSAVSLTVPAYRLREETSKGLYFELAPQEMDAVSLTMIPYYMWANRGENEMLVFLHLV